MIEGLRQLPWVQEQRRRNPHSVDFDCGKCKAMHGTAIRQAMGCGYEVPIAGARPWSPVNLDASHTGEFKTCPGYTTRLPEIGEAASARMHGKMGTLPIFLGKHEPAEIFGDCLLILEGATNEVSAWAMKPKAEGGGGV